MAYITSYLYDNEIVLQFVDNNPAIKTRNRVVYNRTLDIYKGTDNPIAIQFKNQDQKPVNITGHTITGFIAASPSGDVMSNVNVTISNASIGTASIILSEELLATLPENQYKIAFKSVANSIERPLYSDDNYGLWIEFNIKPGFGNQGLITIPSNVGNVDLSSPISTPLNDDIIDLGAI